MSKLLTLPYTDPYFNKGWSNDELNDLYDYLLIGGSDVDTVGRVNAFYYRGETSFGRLMKSTVSYFRLQEC